MRRLALRMGEPKAQKWMDDCNMFRVVWCVCRYVFNVSLPRITGIEWASTLAFDFVRDGRQRERRGRKGNA